MNRKIIEDFRDRGGIVYGHCVEILFTKNGHFCTICEENEQKMGKRDIFGHMFSKKPVFGGKMCVFVPVFPKKHQKRSPRKMPPERTQKKNPKRGGGRKGRISSPVNRDLNSRPPWNLAWSFFEFFGKILPLCMLYKIILQNLQNVCFLIKFIHCGGKCLILVRFFGKWCILGTTITNIKQIHGHSGPNQRIFWFLVRRLPGVLTKKKEKMVRRTTCSNKPPRTNKRRRYNCNICR